MSYREPIEVAPGVSIEFVPAGHLLGSAYVIARLSGGKTILFGGDLGRYARPVLQDPADPVAADLVLVESTYGDRDHEPDDDGEHLARVIRDTAARGGKVIVPAFAIGRVEELLYWIGRLERERRIPVLPVYVDSPMAADALKFYAARTAELDPDIRPTHEERVGVRHRALPDHGVAAAVEGADREPAQRGGDLGERHGHRWPRAAPPRRRACPTRATRCSSPASRPKAPAAGSLIEGAADVKIHGQFVPVRRTDRKGELDVGARRSRRDSALAAGDAGRPLRDCAWCTASPGRWMP